MDTVLSENLCLIASARVRQLTTAFNRMWHIRPFGGTVPSVHTHPQPHPYMHTLKNKIFKKA